MSSISEVNRDRKLTSDVELMVQNARTFYKVRDVELVVQNVPLVRYLK